MRLLPELTPCSLVILAFAAATASPVLAQDDPSAPVVTVSVPTIQSVNSNVPDDTLRAIISGDIAANAVALANLTADSITIPEITVSYTIPMDGGAPVTGTATYRNILLDDIEDGVADASSIGSLTSQYPYGTLELSGMKTDTFDIGNLLRFYGLVPADGITRPQTIYEDFSIASGRFVTDSVTCDFGRVDADEFRARPLNTSFADMMTLTQTIQDSHGSPNPDDIAKVVSIYADLFSAMESSPMHMDGLACVYSSPSGDAQSLTVGSIEIGSFRDSRYPEITVENLAFIDPGSSFSFDRFVIKGFDFSNQMTALVAAGSTLSPEWFQQNYRKLIPPFEGLALSGLEMDLPSGQGQRTRVSVGEFDLSLDDYVEGIPSEIGSYISDLVYNIPTNSIDQQFETLLALGVTQIVADYNLNLEWNERSNSIDISRFSVSADDLFSLGLAGVLGNATRDLFSPDMTAMRNATMGLTAKELEINLEDYGLGSKLFTIFGQQQNLTEQAARSMASAALQAMVIQTLGTSEQAQQLATALIRFVGGGTSLSINITAASPAGLTLPELAEAQTNPTALFGKIEIDAHAE